MHLPALVSIPGALVLAGVAVALMRSPSDPKGPPGRRAIRQTSMGLRLIMLVPMVVGLSFADPKLEPLTYAWAWGLAALLLLASFCVTALDVMVSLRHAAKQQAKLELQALVELGKAAEGS